MRIIPTGSTKKIAIIAATKAELTRLQRLKLLDQFNTDIATQPQKSDKYQCFIAVYAFETGARARLFRLAYSLAKKNGKLLNIKSIRGRDPKREMHYKRARQATAKRRAARKNRRKVKRWRLKLIPILRAGRISQVEEKARQIAREQVIIDLL